MILSKNSGNALVNFAGVSFATKTFGMPKSSRLRRRALAREVLISLLPEVPVPEVLRLLQLPCPGLRRGPGLCHPARWGCGRRGHGAGFLKVVEAGLVVWASEGRMSSS